MPALGRVFEMRYWTEDSLAENERRYPSIEAFTVIDDTAADVNIFNIGNNHRMHSRTWNLSRESAGITILHDTRLLHLFCASLIDEQSEPDIFAQIMRAYYGRAGAEACRAYFDGQIDINELSSEFPLTELALINSIAVVVHTDDQQSRLTRLGIPYHRLELPHPSRPLPARVREPTDQLKLFTFGYISSNRCLAQILEGLSACRDDVPFRFVVAGEVAPEVQLDDLIHRHRLDDRVEMVGFLEGEVLDRHLQEADLVFNLRNPTMGEASSAQLRIWDNAAVALVSRTGWYAGIPNHAAIMTEPGREAEEVASVVKHLHANRDAFSNLGPEGKRHLERNHSPDHYAARLGTIAEQTHALTRPMAPFALASRCADEVAGFLGKAGWASLFGRAFDHIDALIPPPPDAFAHPANRKSRDSSAPE